MIVALCVKSNYTLITVSSKVQYGNEYIQSDSIKVNRLKYCTHLQTHTHTHTMHARTPELKRPMQIFSSKKKKKIIKM